MRMRMRMRYTNFRLFWNYENCFTFLLSVVWTMQCDWLLLASHQIDGHEPWRRVRLHCGHSPQFALTNGNSYYFWLPIASRNECNFLRSCCFAFVRKLQHSIGEGEQGAKQWRQSKCENCACVGYGIGVVRSFSIQLFPWFRLRLHWWRKPSCHRMEGIIRTTWVNKEQRSTLIKMKHTFAPETSRQLIPFSFGGHTVSERYV